jgi:BirA family biotin operon repressor/biotin-[acetyl-CoA-carboxylase] ligase
LFDPKFFKKELTTSWLGCSFYFFEEMPSTNSFAKKVREDSPLHGSVVLTDHQTGGRGQHERKWMTEKGQNLTFSLIFEPKKAERFTLLTLTCALAVRDVINELSGLETLLKWPNDILNDGKKLCGILTETQFSGNSLERIVVGIGLNVNQQKFPGELADIATSISKESSRKISREKLLAEILQNIEYRYRLWNQFNADLVKDINRAMVGFGEWTSLVLNGEKLAGEYKFLGVNEVGELVALNEDLDVKRFAYEQIRVV